MSSCNFMSHNRYNLFFGGSVCQTTGSRYKNYDVFLLCRYWPETVNLCNRNRTIFGGSVCQRHLVVDVITTMVFFCGNICQRHLKVGVRTMFFCHSFD